MHQSVEPTTSADSRRSRFVWALCCGLAGVVFVAYVLTSFAAGQGQLVMPLDDVYIHFQYAHQIARGEVYVYNPGLPPTSGATSFLYPYLLAVGDLLGFRGLNLGLWAMTLGALALAGSSWLVYRLGRLYARHALSLVLTVAFALTGAVAWHFMSGMETGLVIFFVLLALYGFAAGRLPLFISGATLLALIRPEGGVLALLAVGVWLLRWQLDRRRGMVVAPASRLVWLLLPVLALGLQPLVNLLVTGSAVASGNAAKSLFGVVPLYPDFLIARVVENVSRMLAELVTGFSPREGFYLPVPVSVLALAGVVLLLVQRRWLLALLLLAWFGAGFLAISTLDTAFWHFKRYQMPLLVLFFPMAAWGWALFWRRRFPFGWFAGVVAVAFALVTFSVFLRYHAINVGYVYAQPLQMARWLQANTPPESLVAVHDTGSLRYLSHRTTLDIVGLTTPGAAAYWRNGPGAVAEFLDLRRPDYIVSYGRGHGYGLGYLADTSLFANPQVEYPVVLDPSANVALAADVQGIYVPDWAPFELGASGALQPSTLAYIRAEEPLASLDVANLESEESAGYSWRDAERLGGFPTDVYEMNYIACAVDPCRVADGGRQINGEETFTLDVPADRVGQAMILITRLHPVTNGTFDVYANGTLVGTRTIPLLPGAWLETATLIPAELVTDTLAIRILPHTPGGHYRPYHHWLYPAAGDAALPSGEPLSTMQDGALRLYDVALDHNPDAQYLAVSLLWGTDGAAQGDYNVFVHLYDEDGNGPVAQADARPGSGTLPPGNWLPGTLRDTFMVDLSQVPPGRYRVAIGLYDPLTQARLQPTGGDDTGRLFVGEVEVGSDG